jgi:polysaccharide pyruvyl transferase WcaK-like protein
MQQYIFEAFGKVVNIINLPATSRYESHGKAGLSAQTIYDINLYGDGVIIGGGNLYENGELQVDTNALEALEVPLLLFSLSHGRVYNRRAELVKRTNAMPNSIIQALNKRASFSLARDHFTCQHLHDVGATKAAVGGCPTIFLNRISNRLPSLHETDKSGILISIRNPSLMSIPLRKQAAVYGHVNQIIDFLKTQGHNDIRLLCHDHRDIPFAASFSDIDFVYLDDIYTYLSLLNNCKLNITYRLHSALPCLSFGRPTIPISYDERAISLFQTIGYEDWNINMLRSSDPVSDVIDRYQRLGELPERRIKAEPIWTSLDNMMRSTFLSFANEVREFNQKK